MSKVEALLFDLGGVVIEIDFGRIFAAWSNDSGVSAATIRSRFSLDSFYEQQERGEIGRSAYFASLRDSLKIDLTDAQFDHGWKQINVGMIAGVESVLEKVAPQIPTYAFTNSNASHRENWSTAYATELSHFSHIFDSSILGLRKPTAAAFEAVASAIDVPLDKILFFDDMQENIDGAQAVGMQTVLVNSNTDVVNALTQLALLRAGNAVA